MRLISLGCTLLLLTFGMLAVSQLTGRPEPVPIMPPNTPYHHQRVRANAINQNGESMLVLTRKEGEEIYIGDNIIIKLTAIEGNHVRLAIQAPGNVTILRAELRNSDESRREGWREGGNK